MASTGKKEHEEEENSPVPQVAMTVSVTDDPTLPVLTFRMWVLGTVLHSPLLSQPVLPLLDGATLYLMARILPERVFFKGSRWEFTLNPGPFNIKEHVLITIFANSGAGGVYWMHIVTAVKAFSHKRLNFFASFLVLLTTQVLGFGWAGIFRRYLVLPAEMW